MKQPAKQRTVHCDGGDITYLLTRKPVKNVNLRIKPDGQVLVSANNRVPIEFIETYISQKQQYIFAALSRYEERRKLIQDTPKRYESGEHYNLLGKSLCLKVEESIEEGVHTDGAYIFLKVKNKDDFRHKEILMSKWLKQYQTMIFQEQLQETYKLFQKYKVPYPALKIRCMKTRWGSCQPDNGIITLNSRLIETPKSCIEYVVLHEFAHFVHPNHSKQFWDFVTMLMPDWKERKKELEKWG